MGSKARHAKHIVPILMSKHDDTKPYIEPFVGGGNLIQHVPASDRRGSDVAEYAIALLDAVSKGWVPPPVVTESMYSKVRANPDLFPQEFVGFLAYSCSYAGKFWGGYARGNDAKGSPRNFADEQARHLLKQASGIAGVSFSVCGYKDVSYPDGSTVYMDPPYASTTGYKGGFDHNEFWQFCADLSKRCRVFVSEYNAPCKWLPVWEKSVTNSLTKDTGSQRAVEKLFTMKT